MLLIDKKLLLIIVLNNRIETLNITWFYRICRICDILNEVLGSWFHLVLKFE